MGIERLVSVMNDDELFDDLVNTLDAYIMPLGDKAIDKSFNLANFLRLNGYSCEVCYEKKNIGQQFKKAIRRNAVVAIIIGENELNNDEVIVKDLTLEEQKTVKNGDLLEYLDEFFGIEDEHHFFLLLF